MDDGISSWLPDLANTPLDEIETTQDPEVLQAVKKVTEAADEPPEVFTECWDNN